MSVSASKSKLAAVTKQLHQHWRDTEHYWRDAKSQEFEQKYLAGLIDSVENAVSAMDKLETLLAKIRHDCGQQQ